VGGITFERRQQYLQLVSSFLQVHRYSNTLLPLVSRMEGSRAKREAPQGME
jgi:hypothetical protein